MAKEPKSPAVDPETEIFECVFPPKPNTREEPLPPDETETMAMFLWANERVAGQALEKHDPAKVMKLLRMAVEELGRMLPLRTKGANDPREGDRIFRKWDKWLKQGNKDNKDLFSRDYVARFKNSQTNPKSVRRHLDRLLNRQKQDRLVG
jgi:hypothetical protein